MEFESIKEDQAPLDEGNPEKIGAGLLLVCNGEALLLRRSAASGNPGTLGLPGGNADPEDTSLLETALREGREEMGEVPPHILRGEVLTKRGKHMQKHYTVFIAEVSPSTRHSWMPTLNEEHTDFEWVSLSSAGPRPDLHPVLKKLLTQEPNRSMVFAAAGLESSTIDSPNK